MLRHKLRVGLIILVIGVIGYFGWNKFFPPTVTIRYVEGVIERGVLSTTVSGSGQVSATSQVDLKPKASGDVIAVNVKVGQEVKVGTLLLSLNARDALKAVRDAQDSLETAQLSLAKLKAPTDALSLLQSENSLAQAKESLLSYQNSLIKSYEDGFNTVTNAFLDLPTLITGLDGLLLDYDFENYSNVNNADWYLNGGINSDRENEYKMRAYHDDVFTSYTKARTAYEASFANYKTTSRASSTSTIEALILETYETTKLIADAVKNYSNFIDAVKDSIQNNSNFSVPATVGTHQTTLSGYTGKTNSHLSNLLSIKSAIETAKNNIVNTTRGIAEKTISFADLQTGPDALDLRTQEISVKQKQNALLDAQINLSDYSVRAPFSGVIAALTAKKGDSISSGSSVGTLITTQQQAIIAFNEIDVAKVKVGQKASLTFDAVEALTITGEVAEVDTIGAVTQGVVSYNVKIVFDVQDERVKPGMTVSVNIILASKPDVLLVSSGAVKFGGGKNYVEQLDATGASVKKEVVIGESNDTQTEIVSGLNEGDKIITQTISLAVTTAPTATGGGGFGGSNAAGAAFRVLR